MEKYPKPLALGLLLSILMMVPQMASSQVLIALLLGDKLNSPNLEFGIEGGFNRSYLSGIEESKGFGHFHLGFYFDFRLKNDLWLNTGVRVKSNAGAKKINPYSLADPELDSVFLDRGHIDRKLAYFYVPVHIKYRFAKNKQFFINLGAQIGLRAKVNDIFYRTYKSKNDASFRKNIDDHIRRLDAGLSGGIGYKFKGSGLNLSVTYYHGLVNIMKPTELDQYNYKSRNSSIYISVGVPVGAGKKAQEAE